MRSVPRLFLSIGFTPWLFFGMGAEPGNAATYNFTFTASGISGLAVFLTDSSLNVLAGSTLSYNGLTGTLNTAGSLPGLGLNGGVAPQLASTTPSPNIFFSGPSGNSPVFSMSNGTIYALAYSNGDSLFTENSVGSTSYTQRLLSAENLQLNGAPAPVPGTGLLPLLTMALAALRKRLGVTFASVTRYLKRKIGFQPQPLAAPEVH